MAALTSPVLVGIDFERLRPDAPRLTAASQKSFERGLHLVAGGCRRLTLAHAYDPLGIRGGDKPHTFQSAELAGIQAALDVLESDGARRSVAVDSTVLWGDPVEEFLALVVRSRVRHAILGCSESVCVELRRRLAAESVATCRIEFGG